MIFQPERFTGGQPFAEREQPVDVDGLGGRDNGGAAANADGGAGRMTVASPPMAQLTADQPQSALGERHRHVAAAGSRIVDEFVDHDLAVRRDAERASVKKEKLHGSRAAWS